METADMAVNLKIGNWVYRGLKHLFPQHCVLCGCRTFDADICTACDQDLPHIQQACFQCGLPLVVRRDDDLASYCGQCLNRPPAYQATIVPLAYAFPVDKLIHQFKYRRGLRQGKVLVTYLIQQAAMVAPAPELIVPVPLHRFRLIRRGFNQAYELARDISRALNIPLDGNSLYRKRSTRTQQGMNAKQRRRNLKQAFALRRGASLPKHVALVDDVMTTGSTLNECARLLHKAGVQRVDAWVLARVI